MSGGDRDCALPGESPVLPSSRAARRPGWPGAPLARLAAVGSASGPARRRPPGGTAAAGDPQALARQAYLGMWQAFVAASRTADYQYPSLDHYAAGAALNLLIQSLYQNYRAGIVTRGQPSFDPVVTMTKTPAGTAEAKVSDCADDTTRLPTTSPASSLRATRRDATKSAPMCSRLTARGR